MNPVRTSAIFSGFTRAKLLLGLCLCFPAACSTAATFSPESSGVATSDGNSDLEELTSDGTASAETEGGSEANDDASTTGSSTVGDTDTEQPREADVSELIFENEFNFCDVDNSTKIQFRPHNANTFTSPVQTRSALYEKNFGVLTDIPIRPWEFLNYYSSNESNIKDEQKLVLDAELYQPSKSNDSFQYHLQVRMQTHQIPKSDIAPIHLVLALDTSSSMAGKPLSLLKESCMEIIKNLRDHDRVSIVTWGEHDSPLIEDLPINPNSVTLLLDTINSIHAEGGADLYKSLKESFELAEQFSQPDTLTRIMLISDGGPPAQAVELDLITQKIAPGFYPNVAILGFGVGEYSTYNPELMDSIAAVSGGASVFFDNETDIKRTFDTNFVRMFDIAVQDISVELELPPGFQLVDVTGNPLSGTIFSSEPLYLTSNNTLVTHHYVRACNPTHNNLDSKIIINATYFDPIDAKNYQNTIELAIQEDTPVSPQFHKELAILSYADLLRVWRDTWFTNSSELKSALSNTKKLLDTAQSLLPNDQDLGEIRSLFSILDMILNTPS